MALIKITAPTAVTCDYCNTAVGKGTAVYTFTGGKRRPRTQRFFCSAECAEPQGALVDLDQASPLLSGSPQRVILEPFKPPRVTAKALGLFGEIERPTLEQMRQAEARRAQA